MSKKDKDRALLESAFKKIKSLKKQVEDAETLTLEPIAIVGIGCRFPGSANSVEEYWKNLLDGDNSVTDLDNQRWNHKKFYEKDTPVKGKTYSPKAGLIDDVLRFDADLFRITPREAECMDPQQRQMLEVTWEALENAGMPIDKIRGSNAGVFVGVGNKDHSDLLMQQLNSDEIVSLMNTGNHESIQSGRLSYYFDLKGPCLTLNTACSSSMLTIHLACQSLRLQECEFAIAGGCNLILSPVTSIAQSQAAMLSKEGYCKTFDESADGFVRSEGVGMVVLKPLSKALKDNDHIYSVIKGSAINQDGLSQGITAPNGPSQESVIRAALKNAKTKPEDVTFTESHGTGTKLGDPIEMRALGSVYGRSNNRKNPLIVGAVKSNIGHAEAAAGVAGIIKLAKVIQTGVIPQNLHCNTVNPYIDLDYQGLAIPSRRMNWPESDGKNPRVGAVSSFGFSGSNGHLIMESLDRDRKERLSSEKLFERFDHLLRISGKTKEALVANVGRAVQFLEGKPNSDIADICYSYNVGRRAFENLVIASGCSASEIIESLKEEISSGVDLARTPSSCNSAFFLSPLTSVEYQTCKDLHSSSPVFFEAYENVVADLHEMSGEDIGYPWDTLSSQSEVLSILQKAACFYALNKKWRSLGFSFSLTISSSVEDCIALGVINNLSAKDYSARIHNYIQNSDGSKKVVITKNRAQVYHAAGNVEEIELNLQCCRELFLANSVECIAYIGDPSYSKLFRDQDGFPQVFSGFTKNAVHPMVEIAQQYKQYSKKCSNLNLSAWDEGYQRQKVPVPTYVFQGESYWLDSVDPSGDTDTLKAKISLAVDDGSDCKSVRDFVLHVIADIAKTNVEKIDLTAQLMAGMGFDSLMIVSLRDRIAKRYASLNELSFEALYEGTLTELLDIVESLTSGDAPVKPSKVKQNANDKLMLADAIEWLNEWKPDRRNLVDLVDGQYRLDKKWVHKHQDYNALLGSMSKVGESDWLVAEVYRCNDHPFFYEHPQDHVPGLYMIEAARQFGLASAHLFYDVPMDRPFIMDNMSISFSKFAEKDKPLYLLAEYSDTLFIDGVLSRTNNRCYIVQGGEVLGEVSGRGLIMEGKSYKDIRLDETA